MSEGISERVHGAESVADRAEQLLSAGRLREAVDQLAETAELTSDPELQRLLVGVRHRAAVAAGADSPPAGSAARPRPDLFAGDGVPEVDLAALDADVLASALQHRGCLLVRGFFDQHTVESLLDGSRRALDAADAMAAGGPVGDAAPWYVPFEAEEGYNFGSIERAFTRNIGGVLTVESPPSLERLISAFRTIGFGELLAEHFGEWPMISAKKSTLRCATPSSPTEWHQDGAFLGTQTRTVNAWVALTACGRDAPGMDVFPKAFDHIVETGTDSARFQWSVSSEQADRVGSQVASPEFDAGDALLFDQMTLHRSAIDPSMTRDRYAIESWFFAPSRFPYEQVPILF